MNAALKGCLQRPSLSVAAKVTGENSLQAELLPGLTWRWQELNLEPSASQPSALWPFPPDLFLASSKNNRILKASFLGFCWNRS